MGALPEWIDKEIWSCFLEMRKKKKIPTTDRAAKLIVGKLEVFRSAGHNPNDILDVAIEHGWTTVWLPREMQPKAVSTSSLPTCYPESDYRWTPERNKLKGGTK